MVTPYKRGRKRLNLAAPRDGKVDEVEVPHREVGLTPATIW
jgi:hypothetical protein